MTMKTIKHHPQARKRKGKRRKRKKEKKSKKDPPDGDPDGSGDGGGNDGASSTESDKDDDDWRKSARIKEQDEIKLSPLPMASHYRSWKTGVYAAIHTASGRGDDKALRWIRRPEKMGQVRDDFRHSGKEFQTLDIKLAPALLKLAKGEL